MKTFTIVAMILYCVSFVILLGPGNSVLWTLLFAATLVPFLGLMFYWPYRTVFLTDGDGETLRRIRIVSSICFPALVLVYASIGFSIGQEIGPYTGLIGFGLDLMAITSIIGLFAVIYFASKALIAEEEKVFEKTKYGIIWSFLCLLYIPIGMFFIDRRINAIREHRAKRGQL